LVGTTHQEGLLVTHDRHDPSGSFVTRVPAGLAEADAELYRQGRGQVRAGRFAEALAIYRELVRRQPDLPDVWAEMGALYNLTGDADHAIGAYRQVVRTRPGDGLAWYNLGALLQNQSRPAEAIPAFQEALRLTPKMALAWYGLGLAHRSQGHPRDALAAYQQAVRCDPELAAAWYRLGTLYEHDEEYGEAIRAYREAVRARRDYAVAWYSLAVLCRDEGQLAAAADAFLESLRLKPHDTDAWVGLGITYARQRNREGVLEVYQELAILDPPVAESFAAQYLDGWPPTVPTPPAPPGVTRAAAGPPSGKGSPLADVWYEMGVQHREQGQTTEAIADFVEAVRFDPDHGKAWFSLAILYHAAGRLDDALRALRELLRGKPRLAAAWRHLGSIHAQRGQHEKAAKAFRRVVQTEPDDVEGWTGLGRACIALDYPAGVAEVVEKLRALNPPAADRLAEAYAAAPAHDGGTGGAGTRQPVGRARGSEDRRSVVAGAGQPVAGFDAWLTSLRGAAAAAPRDLDTGRLPLASASGDRRELPS
jgi:tetratricopeptide (TPR) repeat protein